MASFNPNYRYIFKYWSLSISIHLLRGNRKNDNTSMNQVVMAGINTFGGKDSKVSVPVNKKIKYSVSASALTKYKSNHSEHQAFLTFNDYFLN